jgi:hypothetical protein
MEYVKVTYPENREVLIDGVLSGETNKILRLSEGTHEFSLGTPIDYEPKSRVEIVSDTNVLDPLEIIFHPK